MPKCNKPTAIQPISDRQQPVFLYLINTIVNNSLCTLHRMFTTYLYESKDKNLNVNSVNS
ncbi:hypothetical protein AM363_06040 [Citrobacter freundii]|uniref:Uncharacterized protein n=1 Tax=Citrobacter freundii TaxID=546 RepID=A0AB33GVH3_CITFR|nr:hypothetical protein AM363_06040 [Citrobacter freundii]RWS95088.1 hypothetical protein DN462_00815 [Citrobacter freundii]